jgi:hypothetical protein
MTKIVSAFRIVERRCAIVTVNLSDQHRDRERKDPGSSPPLRRIV